MHKALIVDDEKPVRLALRNMIDWKAQGIHLVGEADNGRNALLFLENNPVDLLLTDLSMPGLSGLPFIEQVQKKYPELQIVILTMHQEFDLVQQALRMGVLDYITKTQIQKDDFSDMMASIVQRMESVPKAGMFQTDILTLIYTPHNTLPTNIGEFSRISTHLLLGDFTKEMVPMGGILITVSAVLGQKVNELSAKLEQYLEHQLFYQVTREKIEYSCSLSDAMTIKNTGKQEASKISERLETFAWVTEKQEYDAVVAELIRLDIPKSRLSIFFHRLYLACSKHISLHLLDFFEETDEFMWWYEWKEWLDELQSKMYSYFVPENTVEFLIENAIRYLNENFQEDITLDFILQKYGISKSNFTKSFKIHTGKTFGEYLRDLRLEKASFLLVHTEQSILSIAECVGYHGERNFRRIFTQTIGCGPNEYRKRHNE